MTGGTVDNAAFAHLVGLLRCAVSRTPPESALEALPWPAILGLARQHGVDAFLFPWLAEQAPQLFSSRAQVSQESAAAQWRALFLEAVAMTLRRQRQLAQLFQACALARIEVVALKGACMSETVYDDPARRQMSDIDLLVHETQLDACHAVLEGLGYRAPDGVLHQAFAYDQAYRHPEHPYVVELHWRFSPRLMPERCNPEPDAILRRVKTVAILGSQVGVLAFEDQLAHGVQHMLHHTFAAPLRSYLDLALLLCGARGPLDRQALCRAAEDWRLGAGALPFVAQLVVALFRLPLSLPEGLACPAALEGAPLYQLAWRILSTLPPGGRAERDALAQVEVLGRSPAQRVRLALSRIFLPRPYLSHIYPCARHTLGLPWAWVCRARDLYRRHGQTCGVFSRPLAGGRAPSLANAEWRRELVRALFG